MSASEAFQISFELVHESFPVINEDRSQIETEDKNVLINLDFPCPSQPVTCKNGYETSFKFNEKDIELMFKCTELFPNDKMLKLHHESCLFRNDRFFIFHSKYPYRNVSIYALIQTNTFTKIQFDKS